MRSGGAVAAAVVLLTLAACNGDDEATTATTTAPAPTTTESAPATDPATTVVPTTTGAPTTTAAPPDTTAAADTTAPPTSPDTTPAPDDPVAQAVEVLEAVEAATLASLSAVRSPSDDKALAQLDEHFTGVLLEGWQNVVADYRQNNLRQIENPDQPDDFLVELASLALSETGVFATVQGCEITAGIVVEVGGNPDGTDRVVEDGVARTVLELEVVLDDGTWKVSDARVPDESERIASCE